jgi:hypothetical protein
MSGDERRSVIQDKKIPGVLWPRLEESRQIAKDYCLLDGFDSILESFETGPEQSKFDGEGNLGRRRRHGGRWRSSSRRYLGTMGGDVDYPILL